MEWTIATSPAWRDTLLLRHMEPSDPIASLQTRKLEQEIAKLEAETALLKRRWFFQAPYIGAIFPIIAVCATGWIAYSNSDFRREAQAAKSAVAKLGPEAESLKHQVAALEAAKASLEPRQYRLAEEVKSLESRAAVLQARVKAYDADISTWRAQLMDVSVRLKGLIPPFAGGSVFPPPSAEPERKKLQAIIDSMVATLDPKQAGKPIVPAKW